RGRFGLMGVVIALIAVLMVMLSGLSGGLVNDGVSGLKNLPVTAFAFDEGTKTDNAFSRSVVDGEQLAAWRDQPDVEAATPIGVAIVNAVTDDGTQIDLTVFGVEEDSFLAPTPSDGRRRRRHHHDDARRVLQRLPGLPGRDADARDDPVVPVRDRRARPIPARYSGRCLRTPYGREISPTTQRRVRAETPPKRSGAGSVTPATVRSMPVTPIRPPYTLYRGNVLRAYKDWDAPDTIISDGAYGVRGFHGDTTGVEGLVDWYRPHVTAWDRAAKPGSTLWFWNTELGWATVHPLLVEHGWEYVQTITWDKGVSHIAGNVNGRTIRRFPVVSEVSVLYQRRFTIDTPDGPLDVKPWLRYEWQRSGLPLYKANEACGVKN